MKLLIVTQKVNPEDPILGFFYRWIEEFSKNFESVTIICLERRLQNSLPVNVKVLSLGKEEGLARPARTLRFFKYIFAEKNNYDAVFVHMNPVYIVLAGLLWRLWGKKITFWYTHKSVDWKLVLAEKLANQIFTASPESFRLSSKKLRVTGHGVDVESFSRIERKRDSNSAIISISRISPTKNLIAIIKAVEILKNSGQKLDLQIIGEPITAADQEYENNMKKYIAEHGLKDVVSYDGPVSPRGIADWLGRARIFVNLSETGSLDKAVLEAMAAGLNILTSNPAFANILPPGNMTSAEPPEIASKITALLRQSPSPLFREYVFRNHNIAFLIPCLSEAIKNV